MKTAAALLAFLLCPAVKAADIDITVVTPARTARAIGDVPGAVEVLTGEQLQSAPGGTLNDKLAALIPGAATNRANGIYSYTSVLTLRGLPANEQGRTLILLDGVPVNTSATGAANWNRLALENVDRVEVLKGPASAIYGSNAAAGVINIITGKSAPGWRLGSAYGTYNTLRANAGAGVKLKGLSLSADGSYLASDGYNSTPDYSPDRPYSINKYVREKNAAARASLELGSGTAEAAYSRTEGLRGEGYKIRTNGNSRRYTTDSARAPRRGRNGEVSWLAQAHYQLEDYERQSESAKSGYTRADTAALREDAGGQAAFSAPLAGLTATLGADYKLGSVDATDTYTAPSAYEAKNRGRTALYAPYAQAEKQYYGGRLKLLAALRYDNAVYFGGYFYNPSNPAYGAVNGPQRRHYWDSFSPKAAASWRYSDQVEQYLSYGRGFRPPALEDMCLTLKKGAVLWVANPGLKPETVDTAETGFRLAPLAGLYIEPSAYYTLGRHFIYPTLLGAALGKMQNIERVRIYGAELPVKYYRGGLSLAAAYGWSESGIEKYSANPALEGKTLVNSPRHTLSANIGVKTAAADLNLAWTYKSRQYTADSNGAWVRGYHNLSASASRALTGSVRISLSAENVFDKRYQESSADLAPGRTLTLSAEAGF